MIYRASNIVFLDIDGVVNNLYIDESLEPKYFSESDGKVSNEQAVRWLNKLCLEADAHIVITSTWRHAGLEICRECLYNSGLDRRIHIIDATPTFWGKERGYEIKQWLKSHPEVKKFVILDDDTDMKPYMDRLVKCDSTKGFLAEEYFKALDLLTSHKKV